MTKEQLLRHLNYCKQKWNSWGEDIFQEACMLALERYQSLDNVNQRLFGLLCKESARRLLKHKKFEIPFSALQNNCKNNDDEEETSFENLIPDPLSIDPYTPIDDCYDLPLYNNIDDDESVSFTENDAPTPYLEKTTYSSILEPTIPQPATNLNLKTPHSPQLYLPFPQF